MNYTYKIRRVDTQNKTVGVVYSAVDCPDLHRNFSGITDFSVASVTSLIESNAQWAIRMWNDMSNPPTAEITEDYEGSAVELLKVYNAPPEYDIRTQKLEESWVKSGDTLQQTWTIIDLSETEILENINARDEEALGDPTVQLLINKTLNPADMTEEELEQVPSLFQKWTPGMVFTQEMIDSPDYDHVVRFEGILYKVLQPHTSAIQWLPPEAVSLYGPFRNPDVGPQPWITPTGAPDAYNIPERVVHDNPNDGGTLWIYESAVDGNTTEPGRDGTFDRWWTPIAVA